MKNMATILIGQIKQKLNNKKSIIDFFREQDKYLIIL